jgi:predicted nucleic acid-binding protein
MLKATLDTDLIVSGTMCAKASRFELPEAWWRGTLRLVISPAIIAEVREVLGRERVNAKFRFLLETHQPVGLSPAILAALDTSL